MSKFLNIKYSKLEAYTPGEQPQDMDKFIKLNTNESPYPPAPGVAAVLSQKEVDDLRLYCDPDCTRLTKKLSEMYNVGTENIFLSNGSDDILNFAFMIFSGSTEKKKDPDNRLKAAFPEISYGFYKVFAELYDIDCDKIPLKEDFSIDYKDYCGLNKMIVIANPNAPTGTVLCLEEIEQILMTNPDNIVLIDEAYVDFGAESAVSLTKKYDNLLVVQTFSKSRSMAGARLGLAIASAPLIADLNLIKYSTNPYNINRLTQIAGVAALEEQSYYDNNCRLIIETREFTVQELLKLGFDIIPSKANFIFIKSDRIDGEKLYSTLKNMKILIRHFTTDKICQYNRVTIGTREQMETFIAAVKKIIDAV